MLAAEMSSTRLLMFLKPSRVIAVWRLFTSFCRAYIAEFAILRIFAVSAGSTLMIDSSCLNEISSFPSAFRSLNSWVETNFSMSRWATQRVPSGIMDSGRVPAQAWGETARVPRIRTNSVRDVFFNMRISLSIDVFARKYAEEVRMFHGPPLNILGSLPYCVGRDERLWGLERTSSGLGFS